MFFCPVIFFILPAWKYYFIQVYPDGQTYFKFISTGDSTDINNKDFQHPFKDGINVNSSSNTQNRLRLDNHNRGNIKTLFFF